jgi:hypothetical protein
MKLELTAIFSALLIAFCSAIPVKTTAELIAKAESAPPGTVIELAAGTFKLPTQLEIGGPVPEDGYTFHIHHNSFTFGYAIEFMHNGIEIGHNLFDFDVVEADGNNLISNPRSWGDLDECALLQPHRSQQGLQEPLKFDPEVEGELSVNGWKGTSQNEFPARLNSTEPFDLPLSIQQPKHPHPLCPNSFALLESSSPPPW